MPDNIILEITETKKDNTSEVVTELEKELNKTTLKKNNKKVTFNKQVYVTNIPSRKQKTQQAILDEYNELKRLHGNGIAKTKTDQKNLMNKIALRHEQKKMEHFYDNKKEL